MSKSKLHKNVWVLTAAQALVMCVNSVIVFAGGLVGAELAPTKELSTLPVASAVVGTALSTLPLGFFMQRIGRKRTFSISLLFSIGIAGLATISITNSSFYLFSFATFLFGFTSATVMQFRFAAMESVEADQIPKAASTVLLGGIIAAFLGPEVALAGKDLLKSPYSGSFALLGGLFAIGVIIIQLYQQPQVTSSARKGQKASIKNIFGRNVFLIALLSSVVGYSIMTFVMTSTPVSMHMMDGHSLSETKWVIQSHIVAMFLPSLITPAIINRIGLKKTMGGGLLCYLICIGLGFIGHDVFNYWISLVLLGVGWNFLFIAGTSLLPQSHSPEEKFQVQSINDFMVFGVQAMASLSAGWFIFKFGWETVLLIPIPIIVVHFIVLYKLKYEKH